MFEDLIRDWDGEEVVVRFDEPTNTWMFVAVHDTTLGPGMGGTRLKSYPTPEDGLRDVLRLSRAMTLKQAAADIPYGGGKAVLAVPQVPPPGSDERRRLILRYADVVASLGGTYVTAADMNTGHEEMDLIAERTPYVLGRSESNGGGGDPGPSTATGVFHGIKAACAERFGSEDLSGRSVLVQGVGSVGSHLVGHLREAGAKTMVSDTDPDKALNSWEPVIEPADVIGTECDVYSPCATGGVLGSETIQNLRCQVVAGAANNQLVEPIDAERLAERGILYAPDYVINAGGVIHLAGFETLGWDRATMDSRLEAIGKTLTGIFEKSRSEGITTDAAAERLARSRIDTAKRTG